MNKNLEYSNLKEKIISALKQNKDKNGIAREDLKHLKEGKIRKLNQYKDVKYDELSEAKKINLIEQYNSLILDKEIEIVRSDLYNRRVVAYLNCIHHKLREENNQYIDSLEELEKIIEEELVSYYNNEIRKIDEKRLLYQNEEKYSEVLNSENNKRKITIEEINDDIKRQDNLEVEKKIAIEELGGVNLHINIDHIDERVILDDNPINVAKEMCSSFKDKILEYEKRSDSQE